MEWITGLFTLLGVALGTGFSEYRIWRERKDKFQTMTFEKRLQAHQEAYRLTMSAGEIINQPDIDVHKFADRLLKINNEAREWLNNNCLYIDKRSQQAFINAFFAVSIYGRDVAEQRQTVNKALEYARTEIKKCLKCVTEGIGAKYLPETDKQL